MWFKSAKPGAKMNNGHYAVKKMKYAVYATTISIMLFTFPAVCSATLGGQTLIIILIQHVFVIIPIKPSAVTMHIILLITIITSKCLYFCIYRVSYFYYKWPNKVRYLIEIYLFAINNKMLTWYKIFIIKQIITKENKKIVHKSLWFMHFSFMSYGVFTCFIVLSMIFSFILQWTGL